MTGLRRAGGVLLLVLVAFAVAAVYRARVSVRPDPAADAVAASGADADLKGSGTAAGFLYGRITAVDGAVYEGRLRWGGGREEAFWTDPFNGVKKDNPWATPELLATLPIKHEVIKVLGLEVRRKEVEPDPARPFATRFGDIESVEAEGKDVRVTLRSGSRFLLDRLNASDFDDEVRVWDRRRGQVLDIESLRVRRVDLLPTPPLADAPTRLHGTVRTTRGDFTGYIQWHRDKGTDSDELIGRSSDGPVTVRFGAIRSLARIGSAGARVTLHDGGDIELIDGAEIGGGNRGIYVEDPRFGRVRVPWEAFRRLDLAAAGSGPGYDDFDPGRPLTGTVTTRTGRRLTGRLVYDLDESETTDTLDVSAGGLDYGIPFGSLATLDLAAPGGSETVVRVTLVGGETVEADRRGDLAPDHTGVLVFGAGGSRAERVPWQDVKRIDFAGGSAP